MQCTHWRYLMSWLSDSMVVNVIPRRCKQSVRRKHQLQENALRDSATVDAKRLTSPVASHRRAQHSPLGDVEEALEKQRKPRCILHEGFSAAALRVREVLGHCLPCLQDRLDGGCSHWPVSKYRGVASRSIIWPHSSGSARDARIKKIGLPQR